MDERLEQLIYAIEDDHWWYRGRRRVINEQIRRLRLPRSVEILDAGCGSGRNMLEFAQLGTVSGIDISPHSVALATARGVGTVIHGSITEMPFWHGRFDFVTCMDVLEHIEDDGLALRELRAVMREGGALLVTVPAYPSLWCEHDVLNGHYRRYTRRSLSGLAVAAGWEIVHWTYFTSLVLPFVAADRRLRRRRPLRSDTQLISDLERTPRLLRAPLERTLELEAWAIGHGATIPAGLSLMTIMRKRGDAPVARTQTGARRTPASAARR